MQTQQLSRSEIRDRASILANQLAQTINFRTGEFNEITHALITDDGQEHPGLVASCYLTTIVEVMGLLTNPEVSKGLTKTTQKQIGPLFTKLFRFFNGIEISAGDIEKHCDYIRLCFSGGLKEEELLTLERQYAIAETI